MPAVGGALVELSLPGQPNPFSEALSCSPALPLPQELRDSLESAKREAASLQSRLDSEQKALQEARAELAVRLP